MTEFLIETHAREKAEMPPEWGVYLLECIGPNGSWGMQLTGAVAPPLKSGPRKGKPNWSKLDPATKRVVYLTNAEHDAWEAAWEKRTGKCSQCVGEGRILASAHSDGTRTYWECNRCKGKGGAS